MFNFRHFAASFFAMTYFPKVGGPYIGTGQPGRAAVVITGATRGAKGAVTQ